MAYEMGVLAERVAASADDVWGAISYYSSVHLLEVEPELLKAMPVFGVDLRRTESLGAVYHGVYFDIRFVWEGSRQLWFGATYVGSGPFALHEHMFGFIEVTKAMLSAEVPVDVKIVCAWPPLFYFFLGLKDHLLSYFRNDLYRQGIDDQKEAIAAILVALKDLHSDQAEVVGLVKSLRLWARAVDQEGFANDKQMTEALDRLAQEPGALGGVSSYFELNIPIVPGMLSLKSQLAAEKKVKLRVIWDRLRSIFPAG